MQSITAIINELKAEQGRAVNVYHQVHDQKIYRQGLQFAIILLMEYEFDSLVVGD